MTLERPEDPARGSRPGRRQGGAARAEGPRVVIFESAGEVHVEVLVLPEDARPGDRFCHCGTDWLVTATRTGDRVLIARPLEA